MMITFPITSFISPQWLNVQHKIDIKSITIIGITQCKYLKKSLIHMNLYQNKASNISLGFYLMIHSWYKQNILELS